MQAHHIGPRQQCVQRRQRVRVRPQQPLDHGRGHPQPVPQPVGQRGGGLVDVFPAGEKEMVRSMLSESLRAVISQTLLKTKDGSGRVAAHEIMLSTPAVRNLIRENKIAQIGSVMQTGQQHGMQTLDQCLQNLVRRNQISIDMARSKASNPDLIN